MKKHKPVLKASFFITSVLAAYFTYQLSIKQLLFLAHLGLLTLWYIFPLPLGFTQIKPLRKLPFLKIFLIAYVWAASTYIMPLIPNLKFTLNESLGFFERFLFLFAITLPFDIKDYDDDKRLKLKTIPNVYGIAPTKWLASICLAACTCIVFFIYPFPIAAGFTLSYFITLPFIWKAHRKRKDIYYLGWIDGTMIWQCILLYLAIEILPFAIK